MTQPIAKPRLDADVIVEIVTRYSAGETGDGIAHCLGMSAPAVINAARYGGATIRSRGPRPTRSRTRKPRLQTRIIYHGGDGGHQVGDTITPPPDHGIEVTSSCTYATYRAALIGGALYRVLVDESRIRDHDHPYPTWTCQHATVVEICQCPAVATDSVRWQVLIRLVDADMLAADQGWWRCRSRSERNDVVGRQLVTLSGLTGDLAVTAASIGRSIRRTRPGGGPQ